MYYKAEGTRRAIFMAKYLPLLRYYPRARRASAAKTERQAHAHARIHGEARVRETAGREKPPRNVSALS